MDRADGIGEGREGEGIFCGKNIFPGGLTKNICQKFNDRTEITGRQRYREGKMAALSQTAASWSR